MREKCELIHREITKVECRLRRLKELRVDPESTGEPEKNSSAFIPLGTSVSHEYENTVADATNSRIPV